MRLKLFLSLLLFSCPLSLWAKPDVVGVSILPEKYFVERIAGDQVEVIVMVEEGYNPVTYEPKPKQLAKLSKALVYFTAGVPFETKWQRILKNNYPRMKLVSLTTDIKLREFKSETRDNHDHGKDLHHGLLDPHFWLSPKLVEIAAKTIRDTLSELDPQRKNYYQKNFQAFKNDLEELDKYTKEKLSNIGHNQFAVFHPSWGYFADEYGLNQIAIETPNRQSGAKSLNRTINAIKKYNIKVIFVQKQFSETDASMIARETSARLIKVDPLAENYLDNMKKVATLFAEAMH